MFMSTGVLIKTNAFMLEKAKKAEPIRERIGIGIGIKKEKNPA